MDNILLQKNNQIERIQRELVECQPLNNMQQAHTLLLRSKDADIQKLRQVTSASFRSKPSQKSQHFLAI
ncbi:hypothetical protein CAEBREN_03354 [Caenorhabditis brenneri]|uniref:Uncharacterized protein n=1 Tax=Caenorhabditis brenneri TaxID=135651 RepID=G0MX99_CAEBE|nr:hypothetical protein CAEBREN_03354 [Caenorhabditis brenneri]